MGWIILILIVLFFAFLMKDFNKNSKVFEKEYNHKLSDRIKSGTLLSGHIDVDESLKSTEMLLDKDDIKIFTAFKLQANIPKNLIKNVILEDASTIQHRVGIKRLLMVGVIAFAWKKKEKVECAYLIIEWKKNNIDMETIFEFEGKGSINDANSLRNTIIKYLE